MRHASVNLSETGLGPAERRVVCVFSVIVTVPQDDRRANAMLNEISVAAKSALEDVLAQNDQVTLTGASSFVWLDDPGVNVHQCNRCKRVFSAENLPNLVHGLPEGIKNQASCYCLECMNLEKEKASSTESAV
jgi:hypothetical protein